jgi:protein involved in polysaccharide export with SLBB domain
MHLFYFRKEIYFVVSVLLICCGCRTTSRDIVKSVTDNPGNLVGISEVPTRLAGDISDDVKDDGRLFPKIDPGMLLNISVTVAGKDEIYKESCNVSRGGDIYLPLLENVDVAGLTIVEAEKKITELCLQYFVEPQVDISFSRTGQDNFVSPWGYVTVMGNVVNPGRIALPQGRKLKLSEAVALAGGLAPSAKDRAVRLIRQSSSGTFVKEKVNLRSIVAGGKVDRDVALLPGDIIFVPETIF